MYQRKQLELHSSISFKLFSQHHSQFQQKQKERHSFQNQNNVNNYLHHTLKKNKDKPQQKKINEQVGLAQKNQNSVVKKIMLPKGTIQQSLLTRLKKLGYISNPVSRNSSPTNKTKKKVVQSKTHRRNISATQSLNFTYKNLSKSIENLVGKASFNYKHVIGRGGFGKVWKVENKKTKKIYAMKQMSKALVITKKSVPSVMNEKKLLSQLKHSFLVNMVCSFQDRETLYLVMDYLPGGDLRHHIAIKRKFSEEQAKFIICCIFLGLKYLHQNNIIHRDIKPQNLVLDAQGYIRITDLGIARNYRPNNSQDTSGTPGYMAPQVLCRQNHTFSVDYFAMGVIAYELMLRKRPYNGRSRKQIRDEVLSKQAQIKRHQIPQSWSLESADFINRLIQRKPANRLGSSNAEEIQNHPWLRRFPFDKLAEKLIVSPYIPHPSLANQSFDEGNISDENTETMELLHQNEIILRNPQVQQLFDGYEANSNFQ